MSLGFIGAGNMAYAIIKPLEDQIYICDKISAALEKFTGQNITKCDENKQVVANSDIIFLCVKPQNFEEALTDIKEIDTANKVFVTIAAGISCDYIASFLGENSKIIRVMPNTPLLIKSGATALCKNANVLDNEFEYVKRIFAMSGMVEVIDESKMNEVIAINGSSPAYIYYIADAVSQYGEKVGIGREKSLHLFCQTLIGSAKMMLETDETPSDLLKKVCSPNGTTLKAVETFDDNDLKGILNKAMENCVSRAYELSK